MKKQEEGREQQRREVEHIKTEYPVRGCIFLFSDSLGCAIPLSHFFIRELLKVHTEEIELELHALEKIVLESLVNRSMHLVCEKNSVRQIYKELLLNK